MKTWGYRAFENKASIDWLRTELLAYPESHEPVQTVLEMFAEWHRGTPDQIGSIQVLAAAVAIAARGGKAPADTPAAVLDWAAKQKTGPKKPHVQRAITYLRKVLAASKLRDHWEKTPHWKAWEQYVNELTGRLESIRV